MGPVAMMVSAGVECVDAVTSGARVRSGECVGCMSIGGGEEMGPMLGLSEGRKVSLHGRLIRIAYIERAADALKSSRVGGGDERPSSANVNLTRLLRRQVDESTVNFTHSQRDIPLRRQVDRVKSHRQLDCRQFDNGLCQLHSLDPTDATSLFGRAR